MRGVPIRVHNVIVMIRYRLRLTPSASFCSQFRSPASTSLRSGLGNTRDENQGLRCGICQTLLGQESRASLEAYSCRIPNTSLSPAGPPFPVPDRAAQHAPAHMCVSVPCFMICTIRSYDDLAFNITVSALKRSRAAHANVFASVSGRWPGLGSGLSRVIYSIKWGIAFNQRRNFESSCCLYYGRFFRISRGLWGIRIGRTNCGACRVKWVDWWGGRCVFFYFRDAKPYCFGLE